MLTKMVRAAVKSLNEETGEVEVILSDESRDRDGDVIRQAGWDLADFKQHPVLVSSHDYFSLDKQIGEWRNVRVEGGELIGTACYYIGAGNPEADWGFELAKRGMAAYSVAFVPGQKRIMKDGGVEFISGHKLLETSHVIVPANQNALQLMAAKAARGTLPEPLVSIMRDMAAEPGAVVRTSDNSGTTTAATTHVVKWPYIEDGWNSHCIVMGCDDAAMMAPPICEEHLRYLVNAPAEPYPEDSEEMVMEALRAAVARALPYVINPTAAPTTRAAAAQAAKILLTIDTTSPVDGAGAALPAPGDGAEPPAGPDPLDSAVSSQPGDGPADAPPAAPPTTEPVTASLDPAVAGKALGALLRRSLAEALVA